MSEIGYDGNPPRLRRARDPGGKGHRDLIAVYRVDRWQHLLDKGSISQIQCEAAQQFEANWESAQFVSYAISGIVIMAGTAGHDRPSDTKMDALQKVSKAIRAIQAKLGEKAHAILLYAVTSGMSFSQMARAINCPRQDVSRRIRACLDILADHYGYGA